MNVSESVTMYVSESVVMEAMQQETPTIVHLSL